MSDRPTWQECRKGTGDECPCDCCGAHTDPDMRRGLVKFQWRWIQLCWDCQTALMDAARKLIDAEDDG